MPALARTPRIPESRGVQISRSKGVPQPFLLCHVGGLIVDNLPRAIVPAAPDMAEKNQAGKRDIQHAIRQAANMVVAQQGK